MSAIATLRRWLPPVLLEFYRHHAPGYVRYQGDYTDWEIASAEADGYDNDALIETIRRSAKEVMEGRAGWERDGVVFDAPLPAWPVSAALARTAAANEGRLHVLDYGGALGTTYLQHRAFLEGALDLHWTVVEQAKLAKIGAREFSTERLRFFETLDEAQSDGPYHVVFFGCVLPYLEHPFETLEAVMDKTFGQPAILLDRTPVIDGGRDRLTVQRVPVTIHPASYPAWFFSESKLLRFFQHHDYRLASRYECDDHANIPSSYRGYLFEPVT